MSDVAYIRPENSEGEVRVQMVDHSYEFYDYVEIHVWGILGVKGKPEDWNRRECWHPSASVRLVERV